MNINQRKQNQIEKTNEVRVQMKTKHKLKEQVKLVYR